jgi:hypothetical protein
MNKKLLCSTALAGALIVSGSALAELKIGGNFTHTTNFGSDESSSTALGSGNRLGAEMNLIVSKTANLNNGMIATYRGVIEFDSEASPADVEYEATFGTKDVYLGLGSDLGNNLSSTIALPAVGFHIATLANNVSVGNILNNDSLLGSGGEATNESHISLNAKAAGGTFTIAYAPKTTEPVGADNDNANINLGTGGSASMIVYTGNPIPNLGFIIGRNTEKADTDTAATEIEIDKIGASYNFGKFRAGYDYQKREVGTLEQTADNFAVTFAASDNLTLGVQHSIADQNLANSTKEKVTALSAGYNLGGASVVLSLVDVENRGATTTRGLDSEGIVITTRIGF